MSSQGAILEIRPCKEVKAYSAQEEKERPSQEVVEKLTEIKLNLRTGDTASSYRKRKRTGNQTTHLNYKIQMQSNSE